MIEKVFALALGFTSDDSYPEDFLGPGYLETLPRGDLLKLAVECERCDNDGRVMAHSVLSPAS
eukprot:24409-Karenia_brevis.AAC.1